MTVESEAAPARFVEPGRAEIHRPRAPAGAEFGGAGEPSERAPGKLASEPAVDESVLQAQRQRTTQGVQSEYRLGAGAQLQPVDREQRHQVELHRVTKWLVDADAVLIDRNALRQAEQG